MIFIITRHGSWWRLFNNIGLKGFLKLNDVWGMLSVFCYIALISICYITLLNLLKNKFTTCFSGEKVLKTPVLLKTAIQFRKRNGVHDFTYTTSLRCKNRYIITKEFYNKQRNQTVIFVSLKRFPQPAKMLHMSSYVFTMWIFLKSTPVVFS